MKQNDYKFLNWYYLGSEIKKCMAVKNISQQDVADEIKKSRASVALWFSNSEKYVHLNPSFDELIKVANLLQLSADDLILLSSDKPLPEEYKNSSARMQRNVNRSFKAKFRTAWLNRFETDEPYLLQELTFSLNNQPINPIFFLVNRQDIALIFAGNKPRDGILQSCIFKKLQPTNEKSIGVIMPPSPSLRPEQLIAIKKEAELMDLKLFSGEPNGVLVDEIIKTFDKNSLTKNYTIKIDKNNSQKSNSIKSELIGKGFTEVKYQAVHNPPERWGCLHQRRHL